jgi:surfeit locus 1 family protein
MLKRMLPVLLASVAGLAVLLSLGFWQLDRLHWKTELIENAQRQLSQAHAPVPAPQTWQGLNVPSIAYKPVELTGHFLAQNFFAYFTLGAPKNGPYGGQGYMVFSPFLLQGGEGVVMVNRGFIPTQEKPRFEADFASDAPQTITGLIKNNERSGLFSPPNDLQKNIYYTRDIEAMSKKLALAERQFAPFYVDASLSGAGGLPQAGETIVRFTNNHLEYVLTWFGLALTLIGVAGAFLLKIWREERLKASS